MKRLIFMLMIFVLVFSVLTANTMLVFAEGEDTSMGTEETQPGGEEGGEELPPESEGTENEGTENGGTEGEGTENGGTVEGGEELPPESEGTGEETPDNSEEPEQELTPSEELFALVGDLKNEIFGMLDGVWQFITSNETYKNIATALLAVLAIIVIPFLVGLLIVAYVAMAAVITVAGALMSLAEGIVGLVVKFGLLG